MRELLSRGDLAQRHEHDLAADADVRIAGVVAEDHRAFPVFLTDGPDEESVADLDLGGTENGSEPRELLAAEDRPALHRDYLARRNGLRREQASPLDPARADARPRRQPGDGGIRHDGRMK